MHFLAVKGSGFVIYSYLKDITFTAVKRDAKFQTRYAKGVTLSMAFIQDRYLFCFSNCYTEIG